MNIYEAITETIDLYSTFRWKSFFSKIRFWDAPYIEVEKLIPKKGKIVDLGCGEGIFTNFLALSSPKRNIIGIELDKKRIEEANRGLKNASFKFGDATSIKIPKSDAIVMFHLLHHLLSYDLQEKLIKRCLNSLNKNGKLIIIEIDRKPFLKYLISWFTDHFLVAWLFEKKLYESNIFFRSTEQWLNLFKKLEVQCQIKNLSKGKPFSHIVLIVRKSNKKK